MSAVNAMMQEFIPAFYKGWYSDFVDPNLDIRDGFLHAPQEPGIGTSLKANGTVLYWVVGIERHEPERPCRR